MSSRLIANLLAAIFVIAPSYGNEAAKNDARKNISKLARDTTNCFVTAIRGVPEIDKIVAENRIETLILRFEEQCRSYSNKLISAYDASGLGGSGKKYYTETYLGDLPRALRERLRTPVRGYDVQPVGYASQSQSALSRVDPAALKCDPEEIFIKLKSIIPKNKFESTKEFQLRRSREITDLGFRDVGLRCAVDFEKTLTFIADAPTGWRLNELHLRKDLPDRDVSVYVGTTLMGRSSPVVKGTMEMYIFSLSYPSIEGQKFLMDTTKARELNNQIGVGITIDLYDPYFETEEIKMKPTIDEPIDIVMIKNFIHANVKDVFIYDNKSGSIIDRISVIECDRATYKDRFWRSCK